MIIAEGTVNILINDLVLLVLRHSFCLIKIKIIKQAKKITLNCKKIYRYKFKLCLFFSLIQGEEIEQICFSLRKQ